MVKQVRKVHLPIHILHQAEALVCMLNYHRGSKCRPYTAVGRDEQQYPI